MTPSVTTKTKIKYIVYSVLFLLLIGFKVGVYAASAVKVPEKAMSAQADNEDQKSSEKSLAFEKEIAFFNTASIKFAVKETSISHKTQYLNTYHQSHHQSVKTQPPKIG